MTFDANVMTNKDHCHPKSKPSWFCNSWLFQLFSPFQVFMHVIKEFRWQYVANAQLRLSLATFDTEDLWHCKKNRLPHLLFLQPLRLKNARNSQQDKCERSDRNVGCFADDRRNRVLLVMQKQRQEITISFAKCMQCQQGNLAIGSNLSKSGEQRRLNATSLFAK